MPRLEPQPEQEHYALIHTRPTPIPPAGIELSVMEVGHICTPPGNIFPQTMPHFCTLAWCTKGSVSLVGHGWAIHAKEGQVAVLGPGQYVTTDSGSAGCKGYYLLMDGPRIDLLLTDTGLWSGIFPYQRIPIQWLEYIAERIHDLSQQPTLATTGHTLFQDVAQQAERAAKDPLVWKACVYLQQNWQLTTTNVESVLKHLRVSRSCLSPRFKIQTGKTILEYLSDIRYYHALRMLAQEAIPIHKIAQYCGFPDAAYFSNWFKKRSGKSPREMKEKV
jgi:AraC-like DNA-binding protein